MPFSESVKREVKEKAAFQCCKCRQFAVQVHHIIPEKDGGADAIENAAPLCPNCHDSFGDNPQKRKEITQVRDWWYTQVGEISRQGGVGTELLSQIDVALQNVSQNQRSQSTELNELKGMLKSVADTMIDNITPATAATATTTIINAKAHANFSCPECDHGIAVLIGPYRCPQCGAGLKPA